MRAYHLGFISDQAIFEHVKDTVELYRRSIDLRQFNKNIIDPIKLTFDAKIYDKDIEEIIEAECIRQIDKSNTNHIGYFHQNLFKHVGLGWSVPDKGFDIVNEERHIFAELKNKHNTLNSRSALATYSFMQDKILKDDEATCILVEVISRSSSDTKWFINDTSHRQIRRMSIDKFYELAFNDSSAFFKLCKKLPLILTDVLEDLGCQGIENSVYEELRQSSPDIFSSLYLLAFRTYNGFDRF
ncbi:Eco47II family restriction endonuclease [uncultured Porphyromonas sp.]|nr:Eco47II family restriction endonuclease [uncultured Porphyromonas sp.]